MVYKRQHLHLLLAAMLLAPLVTEVMMLPRVPILGIVQNLLSPNHLYAVKYRGVSATEMHITTLSSNYTKFSLQIATGLPFTAPSTFQFLLGSNDDLYAINLTDIRRPELTILPRTDNYRTLSFKGPIGIPPGIITNSTAVQFALGTGDTLFMVKPGGADFTEIYILPRVPNYTKLAAVVYTALPAASPSLYRFLLGANDDLYAVKYGGTAFVEVTILSKASYYQSMITLPTNMTKTTAAEYQFLVLASRPNVLYAVPNGGGFPPPPPSPAPQPSPSPPAPPPPPSSCTSAFSCLPRNFTSSRGLLQDPFSLIGGGSLSTGSGKIFSDLSIGALVEIARSSAAGGQICPFVSITGSQIAQLAAGLPGDVGGFNQSNLGSVREACLSILKQLSKSTRYVVGFIANDLPSSSGVNTNLSKVLSAANVSICAAINPCTGVYQFGFNNPSRQELSVSQDPLFTSNFTLSTLTFSSDPRLMPTMDLQRLWNPTLSPMAGGTISNYKFNGKMMVQGSRLGWERSTSFDLRARRSNQSVAFFDFYNTDTVQLAWDPLRIGAGPEGGDVRMGMIIDSYPRVIFSDKMDFEPFEGYVDPFTLHGLWETYSNGSYMLQLSTVSPIRMEDALQNLGYPIIDTVYGLFPYQPFYHNHNYKDDWDTTISWFVTPETFAPVAGQEAAQAHQARRPEPVVSPSKRRKLNEPSAGSAGAGPSGTLPADFYTRSSFPYDKAVEKWLQRAEKRGRYMHN
ncbi:hypothetical protein VOLCADRAFT_103411 [Volvox carteri f. nagariensis]|uniref:Uncharacterized protein n=1 Tax=Volvox carteri f. nagariensis TaxID=3068 RepID=D8TLP5_VOLCA|nr:uncharacterized protein VOLCADRAFT_103411 [Volvox carteri f. nagariensis]EFJ51503.1 hypothetical protein VOLCADRAFT_103411 [Volvox carteri f. nagariensis]|eukprot:XP_002947455.1 hypothetical protein VOLCADRAFT_103411 [Volvox carteri f. nagariensis]